MARATLSLKSLLLIVLVWVLAGCSGADRAEMSEEPTDSAGSSGEAAAPAEGLSRAAPEGDGAGDEDTASDAESQPAGDLELPGATQPASVGERIIKEGTVTLELEEQRFDTAFGQVVDAATRLGGTVVSSDTTTTDSGATAGSVTVQVPVERYEDLLVGVGEIGTVVSRRITAQDVTDEFTDLESRLRHLQAQERFYLELLEEAEGVADAIAVQQQLEGLQGQIEQVQGRLQLLDARTTFSTLTVELFEPGAPVELAGTGGERPDLGRYWDLARDAFVNVVGGMLVAGFFVAPLLVVLVAAYLVWQALRRRSPSGTTPTE
ncbi:MAG: DUF4349 domain-containing protein [Egibacteraceae bacterium]